MNSKKMILFILFIFFTILFISCNGKPDTTNSTELTEASSVNMFLPFPLCNNSMTDYVIICADEANESTQKLCEYIKQAFKTKLNVSINIVNDNSDPYDHEIIVGKTSRPESRAALDQILYYDYQICNTGEKIIIAAHTESALSNAVDRFVISLIDQTKETGFDGQVFFRESSLIKFNIAYAADKITLPAGDLFEYTIIIPKNYSISELRTAVFLREEICKNYGHRLEIKYDDETASAEILIGKTARTTITVEPLSYKIMADENSLQIVAGSYFAYDKVISAFSSLIVAGDSKEVILKKGILASADITAELMNGQEYVVQRCGQIRIMFNNVLGKDAYPCEQRNMMLSELYMQYLPDVIGFQELNDYLRAGDKGLVNLLTKDGIYTEVPPVDMNNKSTPIIYRADILDVIETGQHEFVDGRKNNGRGFRWAVFKIKATGKQFAVVSTHFANGQTAEGNASRLIDAEQLTYAVKAISEKYAVPIFTGGDFNASLGTQPIEKLLKNAFVSLQGIAGKSEDLKTVHPYPEFDAGLGLYNRKNSGKYYYDDGTYNSGIDHIFIYGAGAQVNMFDIVTDEYALLSSDHCPVQVDINFN